MKNTRRILSALLAIALLLAAGALASGTKAFITTGTAYMRDQPNRNGSKLETLPKGTILNAADWEEDERGVKWYYGSYKDEIGWVSEKNLKEYNGKPDPESTPKPTPRPIDYSKFRDAGYYVTVTANSLNMRREPSTDYPVVTSYANGAVVYAVRTNGSWAEIWDAEQSLHGYMSEKYLEKCAEPATVEPNPVEVDPAAPEDGIYAASFAPEDLFVGNGVVVLNNVHLFTKDTYDIVEIARLKAGDTIVIEGEPVKVEQIERGDFVSINGGLDNGGWDLAAIDEDNCYVVWGLDDRATYTVHGGASLELSETVTYTDDADLDHHVEAGIEDIADVISAGDIYGYDAYNTTIRIEAGRIVEIVRSYAP